MGRHRRDERWSRISTRMADGVVPPSNRLVVGTPQPDGVNVAPSQEDRPPARISAERLTGPPYWVCGNGKPEQTGA